MKLVGWIKAQKSDKARLRDVFGVKGKMVYKNGCFEHCELDDVEAAEKLQREFPGFYSDVFTAVDSNGNPLPRDRQPFGYHDGETTTTGVS